MIYISYTPRASGNGLAVPILAGPVFLKVKINFHFYKMQQIKKTASVIFEFVRLSYYIKL